MENDDYTALSSKLLYLRKSAGYTQDEVAEHIKVSRQTISKWETGKSIPDSIMIKRICEYYKISSDDLFELLLAKEEKESEIHRGQQEHIKKKYHWLICFLVIDFIASVGMVIYSKNMVFWIIYANVIVAIIYIIFKIVHFVKIHNIK